MRADQIEGVAGARIDTAARAEQHATEGDR